jgi:hypothetical protein
MELRQVVFVNAPYAIAFSGQVVRHNKVARLPALMHYGIAGIGHATKIILYVGMNEKQRTTSSLNKDQKHENLPQ